MKIFEILAANIACVSAHADIVQQPLQRSQAAESNSNPDPTSFVSEYGQPVHVNTEAFGLPWYYTTIGIGSEPIQNVTAALDLQATNLWVASEHCSTPQCHAQYNSSLSRSYNRGGTEAFMFTLMSGLINGSVSKEDISLDSRVYAKEHQFVEVTSRPSSAWDPPWTAGLGLSLGNSDIYNDPVKVNPILPNILDSIAKDSPDDGQVNMFSLLLPRYEDSIGDLSFGRIYPDMFEGDLVSHALHPLDASGWQIAGPEIDIRARNGTVLQSFDLTDHTAYLDTAAAGHIILPDDVIAGIFNLVPLEEVERDWKCERFGILPEIVFRFDGQDVVLGPHDYLRKEEWPFEGLTWKPTFLELSRASLVRGETGNKTVLLGGAFLRAVYSVFDWRQRTISFAPRRYEEPVCERW